MKKLLLFCLTAVLLMSCGHFHDEPTKSVWANGLWIIPWVTGLGSLLALLVAYRKSKSGSEQQYPGGGYKRYSENVPIYKIGQFYFFCALAIATIVIIIMVNANK